MRIGYVTSYAATDVRSWSGTGYFMAEALRGAGAELDVIDGLPHRWRLADRLAARVSRAALRRRYLYDREARVLKGYAREVTDRLVGSDVDVVLSPGSLPVAYLDVGTPIAFWTDACFAGMVGFYPEFSDLSRRSLTAGNRAEQAALDRASQVFYSSEWARQSAIANYEVDAEKLHVVPFGANIANPAPTEEVARWVSERDEDSCKLLFLGVDWERKGGEVAVAVTERLNRSGRRTELVTAGAQPSRSAENSPLVTSMGFLSKEAERDRLRLREAFASSHFLLLPARADCSPMVLAEACAFGVPVLANAVGGIPTIVRDGVNGWLVEPDGGMVDRYAELIASSIEDRAAYQELAMSARREFQTRLNWEVAAKAVRNKLAALL
jgi:glycosyltransferase involved in cell wall biosynthesis